MLNGIDSDILINLPAGAVSGEKYRVANAGFIGKNGTRGDLLLNIKIMMPKRVSDLERDLLIKLRDISKFNPRSI